MKKKIFKKILLIFIVSLMSIIIKCDYSYGEVATGLDIKIYDYTNTSTAIDTGDIKSELKSYYDYYDELISGDKAMKLVTTISVVRRGPQGNYWIYIGDYEREIGKSGLDELTTGISFENLQKQWACIYTQEEIDNELDNGSGSITWDAVLICTMSTPTASPLITYLYVNEVYTGNDYDDALEMETEEGTEIVDYSSSDENNDDISWIKKFLTNPKGTFTNIILDVIREVADAVQMAINLFQTVSLDVYDDWTVKYDYETLIKDGRNGNVRNQYTNVEDYGDEDDAGDKVSDAYNESDYKLSVLIDDTDGDDYLFEDTKIPIIYVDFYTMAINEVNILDVNFLTGDETHEEDSVWMSIRNFVSSIVFVSFCVAASILIMALIKMGVQIVANSMNPYEKAKNKDELNKLIIGVIMLVGTILIMALSIFSYQAVLGEIYDEDDNELPIRVYFKQNWSSWFGLAGDYNKNYSFSTSFTGYIRFMAEIENPDRCMEKAGYVIAYVMLVIMNLMVLIIMLIRTIVMWVLSIIGPILASIYAITSNNRVMSWYRSWAFAYIVFAMIQVIFAAVCAVLLNVIEFS